MNLVLRGVRVIDPSTGMDRPGQEVRFEGGRLMAIGAGAAGAEVGLDLTPAPGVAACVLAPGFIDLHAHLREPGGERAETVASGAGAAAAGGFSHVLAMANTTPPCDTPERVAAAVARSAGLPVRVLTVAALTRGLAGGELVDVEGCAAAGAVAFSDDGRNAAPPTLLAAGLRAAAAVDRRVLIHPELEELIAGPDDVVRCPDRPAAAEAGAVEAGIAALELAGAGHLHLQHLSTASAVSAVRRAQERGLRVTAEATPHHLAMSEPLAPPPVPASLAKVNPPLRTFADRSALIAGLRDGVIGAIATDHAPHRRADKEGTYADASPGMIGLEIALGTCLAVGADDPAWLPLLVERLTSGPRSVLGPSAGIPGPGLRLGEPATCVLFDPSEEWIVNRASLRSLSTNTPLINRPLRGRVLMTLVAGEIAHIDPGRLPMTASARRD